MVGDTPLCLLLRATGCLGIYPEPRGDGQYLLPDSDESDPAYPESIWCDDDSVSLLYRRRNWKGCCMDYRGA